MEDCIFCKIANEKMDSKKLMESENTVAFLDVSPISEGHTLIIPKNHYENIFDTPEEILAEINVQAKKVAKLLKEKLNITGVNIVNASGKEAQQSVFHLDYHIVPRKEGDELDLWFHGDGEEVNGTTDIYNKIIGEKE